MLELTGFIGFTICGLFEFFSTERNSRISDSPEVLLYEFSLFEYLGIYIGILRYMRDPKFEDPENQEHGTTKEEHL